MNNTIQGINSIESILFLKSGIEIQLDKLWQVTNQTIHTLNEQYRVALQHNVHQIHNGSVFSDFPIKYKHCLEFLVTETDMKDILIKYSDNSLISVDKFIDICMMVYRITSEEHKKNLYYFNKKCLEQERNKIVDIQRLIIIENIFRDNIVIQINQSSHIVLDNRIIELTEDNYFKTKAYVNIHTL